MVVALIGAGAASSGCTSSRDGSGILDSDGGEDASMGNADSGEDASAPPGCPDISFVAPAADHPLDERDDRDRDQCSNGFQFDVMVATTAPEGTEGVLYAGTTQVGTAKVSGALLVFENTQLASNGSSELSVQVGGTDCTAKRKVEVSCSVPSCSITKPVVSATHPKLNGVATENGGDRVSADGAPYQIAVEVATSVENGQPVELILDSAALALSAPAEGGKAVFSGVAIGEDGEHTLEAVCRGKSGLVGRSQKATYVVDTAEPSFTVTEPAEGTHFEEVETFRVCATTEAPDARDLPDSLGAAAQRNFCARIGNSAATCEMMQTENAGAQEASACVQLACPGGPPFDVRVSLRDDAGNVKTSLVKSISCRSERPGVEIIAPVTSEPGNANTNLLAANSERPQRDSDPIKLGAQFTVVACTDAPVADMQLLAGLSGGDLSPLGDPVAVALATIQDGCPAGKPYIARFPDVTLPESQENSKGELLKATRLVAQVTDESSSVGTSPPVDVWVDSVPPTLGPAAPDPLCGAFRQSVSEWTTEVRLQASALPVTLTVTRPDSSVETRTQNTHSSGIVVNFGNLTFLLGDNVVEATVTEPSGNQSSLPAGCTVKVGNPPQVSWVTPALGSKLNGANDGDAAPGWQGTLTVHTDLGGVTPTPTVQFSTNVGGDLGTPVPVDASGNATLAGVTIPEGNAVQLIATTSDVDGRGVGRAVLTLPVDVSVPAGVSSLAVSVPENLRRQTTFRLSWNAPDDNGSSVRGYDVRISESPIGDEASFNAATRVSYVHTPAQPGHVDGIDVADRLIERDYYFAVVPFDLAGNRGPMATVGPARASFRTTTLTGVGGANELYGRAVDGGHDLNGDGFADLVVGSTGGSTVYIYFGSANGYPESASVQIVGPAGVGFGYAVEVVGDIDADGRLDLAIGAPQEGPGRVYIYKGRATWPESLSLSDASYVIGADSTVDPGFASSFLGAPVTRIGDFDGDGADDFAIGAHRYNQNQGYVAIVRGVGPNDGAFPANLSLSTPSSRVISTAGPTETVSRFGWAITGLGKFYPGAGTTIMVSGWSYGEVSGSTANRNGAVFAFSGILDATQPADLSVSNVTSGAGGFSIAAIGALGSPMAVAYGIPEYGRAGGTVQIHVGTVSTGPFEDPPNVPAILSNAASTVTRNAFGMCVFGSVISGVGASFSDHKASFIGSSLPDVAISGLGEGTGPAKIYIIDGQKVPTLTSGDIASIADVVVPLPETWVDNTGCHPTSRAIRDLNNDGYADIAIGQYRLSGTAPGEVLVLW